MANRHQKIWRVARHTERFAAEDLSGATGERGHGRWHSNGRPVVYVASTIALATLETLVHFTQKLSVRNAFLVKIEVPGSLWKQRQIVSAQGLDVTWVAEPPSMTSIGLGDRWLDSCSGPLLLVPSVIVPEEFNVLINPAHPASACISAMVTRQLIYDLRLFNNPSPP